MIKYFIETADGSWLTDPELWFEGQPAFTKDPFKAWMFDEINCAFEILGNEAAPVLWHIRNEGLGNDWLIKEQEFQKHPEGVLSYTWEPERNKTDYKVERYNTGMNIIKEGHVSFVHHPIWDGPIEKFLR